MHAHAAGHPVASSLRLPLLAAAHLVWIPSATLLVVLVALAVAPAYALVHLVLDQVPANAPLLVNGLVLGLTLPAAYVVFCVLFPLFVVVSRWLLPQRGSEGTIALTSPRMLAWYHGLLCTHAVNRIAGPALRAVGLYKWFARGMGMKIGRGSLLNTTNLYDLDLIELGNDVVVGGDAFLTAHIVEGRHLIRRKIRIGHRSVIGLHAVVLPGATIDADCHVGALALVPKNAHLHAGRYGGVPARRLASSETAKPPP